MAKASESPDAYVQYLLAQKQTAEMNGDNARAAAIQQQISDLGFS